MSRTGFISSNNHYDIAIPVIIKTSRLCLSPLKIDDAQTVFAKLQDQIIYKYIPQDAPATLEKLLESYSYRCVPKTDDREEIWLNWLARRKQDNIPIGLLEVTVYPITSAHIAYTIFPEFWRQGYGKESMAAIIDEFLFPAGITKLIAEMDTRNHASIALVEALGFTKKTTIREADFFKGHSSDEFRYVLDLA